jgi:hypothetical protein
VLLTDFGLARAAEDASLTRSGIIAGTPHYMSPEQAHGEPIDARSDLFSLGSVLYFMATGHPPFRAEQAMAVLHRICHDRHRPVWEINPGIPDELADVIDRLLEKKPGRRYASAAEVQQALAGVLSRLQQPRAWRGGRWLRRLRRHRWRLSAAAGVIAGAAAVVWFSRGTVPDGRTGGSPVAPAASSPAAAGGPAPLAGSLADGPTLTKSELQSQENNQLDELAAIGQALGRLAASPYPEAAQLQQFGDPWQKELRAAGGQTARLEQAWSADPVDRSSSNTR